MQTFDQALLEHLTGGRIDMEQALRAATSPNDFKLLVASRGMRASSMDTVAPEAVAPEGPSSSVAAPEDPQAEYARKAEAKRAGIALLR